MTFGLPSTGFGARLTQWLPHEDWVVESPLDCLELAARMKPRLEKFTFRWWWNLPLEPYLWGLVSHRGFSANLYGRYYNGSPVELIGSFCPNDRGTTIQIRSMPPRLTMLFLVAWLGGVGLILVVLTIAAFRNRQWGYPLIPAFMGICGCLLSYVDLQVFQSNLPQAQNLLSRLLAEVHEEAARKVPPPGKLRGEPPPLPAQTDS